MEPSATKRLESTIFSCKDFELETTFWFPRIGKVKKFKDILRFSNLEINLKNAVTHT